MPTARTEQVLAASHLHVACTCFLTSQNAADHPPSSNFLVFIVPHVSAVPIPLLGQTRDSAVTREVSKPKRGIRLQPTFPTVMSPTHFCCPQPSCQARPCTPALKIPALLFPLPGMPFPLLLYLKNSYLPFKTQCKRHFGSCCPSSPHPAPRSRGGASRGYSRPQRWSSLTASNYGASDYVTQWCHPHVFPVRLQGLGDVSTTARPQRLSLPDQLMNSDQMKDFFLFSKGPPA